VRPSGHAEREDPEVDGGEIPEALLPPGFLETLEGGPRPVAPTRPAATVVLLREGRDGLEVLLLQRARTSGFVPGAWVFPGGRVDPSDADPGVVALVDGLTPRAAGRRLGLPSGDPPAIAYYLAAVREAFEETGLWPGPEGGPDPDDPRVTEARNALMAGEAELREVVRSLGLRIPGEALEYMAHWITPVQEPRRYDTRFFAAVVPGGREARVDPREMSGALWIPASEALRRQQAGALPMVFPTIHTLRDLAGAHDPLEFLERVRDRPVPAILPRLVRTATGVALRIPLPGPSRP
jgi:8-oxo-dGTP pyrophosphatase MutT (NUDIX family)